MPVKTSARARVKVTRSRSRGRTLRQQCDLAEYKITAPLRKIVFREICREVLDGAGVFAIRRKEHLSPLQVHKQADI
jgi:hypothetical protein